MKFMIECDDVNRGEVLLNDFCKIAESEYRKQIKKSSKKINFLKRIGVIRKNYFIPEEVLFMVYEEDSKLILSNSMFVPFLMKIHKKTIKKMEENIRNFLEENGIRVFDVKYIGD